MLTGFLFSKESPAYSRDALKGSHFSVTNPVPEEGVLEMKVFWKVECSGRASSSPGTELPCSLALARGTSTIPDV